jgi:hypothetical protein
MDPIQFIGIILAGGLGISGIFKFSSEKIIETGLQKVLHKERLLTEADLVYRQRQLEEFYGPLYASLKLNSKLYPLWLEGKLSEVNQEVIDLFKRQNDAAIAILKTKAHLIEGSEYPPEFIEYMTSATIWGMYCTRSDAPYMPEHVANLEAVNWPQEFEVYIYQKTEELKRELDTLRIKYRAQ